MQCSSLTLYSPLFLAPLYLRTKSVRHLGLVLLCLYDACFRLSTSFRGICSFCIHLCPNYLIFACFLFSSAFLLTVIFRPNVRSSDALHVTLHHVCHDQGSSGPSKRYIEQHCAQDDYLASSGGSPAWQTKHRVTFCCSATCIMRYLNKPGIRWATHRYALRTSGLKITVHGLQ